ncbi:MAG: uridine kinase [Bacteroidota bacterium]
MNTLLMGITGGSASGKTMFLNSLLHRFDKDDLCIISQDNYYLPRDQQPLDENGVKNFDTPQAIDHKAFGSDLRKIKSGEPFKREEYTFNNPNVVPQMLEFLPAPIVVVEGLFVMHFEEINSLLDIKIFIDAKAHVKLKRRIIRDKMERGYDLDDVLYRFERHVMPNYDQYLKPLKEKADIIIPNNDNFSKALDVLSGFMKATLHKS